MPDVLSEDAAGVFSSALSAAGSPVPPSGGREADGRQAGPSASTPAVRGAYPRYAALRDQGLTADQAAAAVGIRRETRRRYDMRWCAERGVERVDPRRVAKPMDDRLPAGFNDHFRTAVLVGMDAPWMRQAACRGLRMEAPADSPDWLRAEINDAALDVCRRCLVEVQCARWVLGSKEQLDPGGVCGGMTEERRRKARQERAKATKARALA